MFKDSFIKGEKNIGLKVLVFPASLTMHIIIVLFLLVYPLLSTGNLPTVEVYSAFLAPPPPPPKKRASKKPRTRIKPVQTQTNIKPGQLVAPVEIPDEIAEEELTDIGIEGGVEGS